VTILTVIYNIRAVVRALPCLAFQLDIHAECSVLNVSVVRK